MKRKELADAQDLPTLDIMLAACFLVSHSLVNNQTFVNFFARSTIHTMAPFSIRVHVQSRESRQATVLQVFWLLSTQFPAHFPVDKSHAWENRVRVTLSSDRAFTKVINFYSQFGFLH